MLLSLIVALIILGAVLAIVPLLPIDGTIKRIITIIVICAVVIWVLQLFLGGGGGFSLGRIC